MRAAATAGAVVAILAGAGIAIATSSGAVINGCVNKKSGVLRIVRGGRCKKSERAIAWNSQGVPGRNGADGTNGTDGTNGADGTNGTDGAVAAYRGSQQTTANISTPGTSSTLLSVNVPEGDYAVSGKVEVTTQENAGGTAPETVAVNCVLGVVTGTTFGGVDTTNWTGTNLAVNVPQSAWLPFVGEVAAGQGSSLALQCQSSDDPDPTHTSIDAVDGELVAVQVASLN
jgi:hypothetical protein